MSRIAVLGAGSWGTAFAQIAADNGHDVVLWGRDEYITSTITNSRTNPAFHPGFTLPEGVWASTNIGTVVRGAQVIVLAIPAQAVRQRLLEWRSEIPADAVVLSLIKGLEAGTSLRMTEVVHDVLPCDPAAVGVLSGPNLAREIMQRLPAAAVVAFPDRTVAELVQATIATGYFRPYTNTDVTGVELGGAVKNVIALAVGIAEGMELGANAYAALMTRGLAETVKLGVGLGANPLTFSGLAGMGDLVATCTSPLSRNRSLGELLGRGAGLAEAIAETKQTAEGVTSSHPLLELANGLDVEMPLTSAVHAVIHEGAEPQGVMRALMSRDTKPEVSH
ncbi:MAG TPA: glycerol-3-phosphate dehydrogenase [Actinobacteria bacterium]|nr:glycerol-3-phosphate dehydrogenase [Actinomycetota bacterium]